VTVLGHEHDGASVSGCENVGVRVSERADCAEDDNCRGLGCGCGLGLGLGLGTAVLAAIEREYAIPYSLSIAANTAVPVTSAS
jgi:hypothetical protein